MGKFMIVAGIVLLVIFGGAMIWMQLTGVSPIYSIFRVRIPYLFEIQMGGAIAGIGLIGGGIAKNRMDAEDEEGY